MKYMNAWTIIIGMCMCWWPAQAVQGPGSSRAQTTEQEGWVKVGKIVQQTTLKASNLKNSILWEIITDQNKEALAVWTYRTYENGSNSPLFGPVTAQVAEDVTKLVQRAYASWRYAANEYLPKEYQLPHLRIVNFKTDEPMDSVMSYQAPADMIWYPVYIGTPEDRIVQGRAGYYSDGRRSSMMLYVLRLAERAAELTRRKQLSSPERAEGWQRRLDNMKESYLQEIATAIKNMGYDMQAIRQQAEQSIDMAQWHMKVPVYSQFVSAVVTHELGHHLGLSHQSGTIMNASMNEPGQSQWFVTKEDAKRLAALVCYIHESAGIVYNNKPCKVYNQAHKR